MSTDRGNIIAFPGARAEIEPATLIIGAALSAEPETVTRLFGVNDRLPLNRLGEALRVLFGWPDAAAPWSFSVDGARIPGDRLVGEVLAEPGDHLVWGWGLWEHRLEVREAFARDRATPDVLCIGGSGHGPGAAAPGADVDVAALNLELTGAESAARILAGARPEVADLVERAGAVEFVPLLQALDLRRETDCEPAAAALMRSLPRENPVDDAAGRDAAWVSLLCLAALVDDDARHDIATHTMDRLAWCRDDGYRLGGEDVEALCADTLEVLRRVRVLGPDRLPADARLELLREALRRQRVASPG